MIEAFKTFLSDLVGAADDAAPTRETDVRLAAAALLFHVMTVDGNVSGDERSLLEQMLKVRFDLDDDAIHHLIVAAGEADAEAVDLYGFTSVLKRNLDIDERQRVVEMMWRMVFADGEVHEFEDNLVWRTAELLGVSREARIRLKQAVRDAD